MGRNGAEVLVLDILGACNPLCILSMTWKELDPEKASAGLHLEKHYNYFENIKAIFLLLSIIHSICMNLNIITVNIQILV